MDVRDDMCSANTLGLSDNVDESVQTLVIAWKEVRGLKSLGTARLVYSNIVL